MGLPDVSISPVPMFRDPATLSFAERTDPDHALKELEKINNGKYSVTCSKCHHCR